MTERYMSRGVGVAMVAVGSLVLLATAVLIAAGMDRCGYVRGFFPFQGLTLVTSMLLPGAGFPSAWRRVLTWQGLFRVAVLVFAVQFLAALVACRTVLLP